MTTKVTIPALLLLLLIACSSTTDLPPQTENGTPSPIAFEPALPGQLKPGDELSLAGSGTGVSETFSLPEPALLRVSWDQSAGQEFTLVVQSLEPGAEPIQFAVQNQPGTGTSDWIFASGSYYVEVTGPGNEWNVVLEVVEFRSDPFFIPTVEE